MFPPNFDAVVEAAWNKASGVEGYIGDREFKALCMLVAAAPREGVTVEIGSFKGKSTIGVASIAQAFDLGRVVSIDPHNAPSATDPDLPDGGSSFEAFENALTTAGLRDVVEANRAPSKQVGRNWQRPIRMLWIDGDHTYEGAKLDFDLFSPFLVEGAIVAIHDTLHEFEGPIRVFVEEMLHSDRFGPAGFLHTIGWAQYRPVDGAKYRVPKKRLAQSASRLLPLVANGRQVAGFNKTLFKICCALVPHKVLTTAEFERLVST